MAQAGEEVPAEAPVPEPAEKLSTRPFQFTPKSDLTGR